MYFYKFEKQKKLLGLLQSETTVHLPNSSPITQSEYENLGGLVRASNGSDIINELFEAIDILTGGKDDELEAISNN